MLKTASHPFIVAAAFVLYCTTHFAEVDALQETSIQRTQFSCKKMLYPIVSFDFTIPQKWYSKWLNSSLENHNVIKFHYQNIALGLENWLEGHCSTTSLFLSRNLSCLFNYAENYHDAKTMISKKFKIKLVYESPEFNDTIYHFTFSGPHQLQQRPAKRDKYDFSNLDIFHCIQTYKPISSFVGRCNEIQVYWFWPLDAFSFRDMWSLRMTIKHNGIVIRDVTDDVTYRNSQLIDGKESGFQSETSYQVCLDIIYYNRFIRFNDNTSVLHDCHDVYTFCRSEKSKKSFLTVESTITLIIILSLITLVMLVVSVVACYRMRTRLSQDDENPIMPIDRSNSVDQTEIDMNHHVYFDSRPYTYIFPDSDPPNQS